MSVEEKYKYGQDSHVRVLRTCQLPHAFHTVAVEAVPNGLFVYCGCSEGKVRVYQLGKEDICESSGSCELDDLRLKEHSLLDTKGGGAVQALWVQRIQNGAVEIVAGDSEGLLTIFSQEQIVWRGRFSSALTSVAAHVDASSCLSYIAGDVNGTLLAFSQWERSPQWRLRLMDDFSEEPMCSNQAVLGTGVRGLASGLFTQQRACNRGGGGTSLIAVCSDQQCVRFYTCGRVMSEVSLPASGTCICTGHFTLEAAARRGRTSQVATGCADGCVYTVSPWGEVELLVSVGQCVTHIAACALPQKGKEQSSASNNPIDQCVDVLICAGHFEGVKMYSAGILIGHIPVAEWVHNMSSGFNSLVLTVADPAGCSPLAADSEDTVIVLGVNGSKLIILSSKHSMG